MYCLCRSSKTISVRIVLLDETDFLHELKDDLPGQSILDVVFSRLNLIETAYFGIRYLDHENQTHWLDPAARISRQLKAKSEPFDLYFGIKFYAADPCKLLEEITRYQLFLQVKQDVLQGRLPVSFELAAELGAYVVQSELGDHDPRRHSPGYCSEFRLITNQTRELEYRVAELHQQLKGMTPSTAELNYLDKVKWHDLYGVDLHPVLGEDSVEYFLGLTPSGIVVLRNKTTVAHYYWPRIAKVYFKGRYFMLRVCDKNDELSTYGFETPRKSACKHLWRCCVEHHAFFRLVRVTPLQPQAGPAELFALGSRFRYSGRTEKQAVRDALAQSREPPAFTRTPSKRQPRRIYEDFLDQKSLDNSSKLVKHEIKSISIPQPVTQPNESPYRSTTSIPGSLSNRQINNNNNHINNNNGKLQAPDSPRSTRSAPWARTQQRGLFGLTASPRSVRSTSTRGVEQQPTAHRFRSSSVESQSSNDSRSGRRHRNRSKRTSDNESELSRGSGRSGRSHNSHRKHRRQRSKHRRNDSGSENDSTRARSYSGHRVSAGSAELIDSGQQWREVQRRQAETHGMSSVQQASVLKSNNIPTKYASSENDGYHTNTSSARRKHRKHRSPSDNSRPKIWSSELAKHLQFDLVDTDGMTVDQLREIPYTVVETHHTNVKRSGSSSLKVHKHSQAKDRVDRIREYELEKLVYLKDSNDTGIPIMNGSIRSASTISSSKECDKNAGLVRIMSSMSMGDFISPSGSSLSPLDSNGLRVSHEHTDSGLGADQDYAYSSERSSDSTKYGTNKSSGASVTSSGHTTNRSAHLSSSTTQLHSVSSRKPPLPTTSRQTKLSNNISTSYGCAVPPASNTVPVHNNTTNLNNNRLTNNTIFNQNNPYTFSLSRISGSNYNGVGLSPNGYLETRPLSSASIHAAGDGGIRFSKSRDTKSDIGVPIRRQSSTKSSSSSASTNHHHHHHHHHHNHHNLNNGNHYYENTPLKKPQSDLISFISNNSNASTSSTSTSCANSVAYWSGNITSATNAASSITTNDYLENYNKTASKYYNNSARNRNQIGVGGGGGGSGGSTAHSSPSNNQNHFGPLLYLESDNLNNRHNLSNKFYQMTKNNANSNIVADFHEENCNNIIQSPVRDNNIGSPKTLSPCEKLAQNRTASLELILTPIIQSSRRAQ